ncbi:hypothetical protein M8494_07540 [Serratia ureilytica]
MDIPDNGSLFNAKRVKYGIAVVARQRLHDKSISNRRRTGQANVDYQRRMKIVEMLERLNRRWRRHCRHSSGFPLANHPRSAGHCHSIRREPDPATQSQITEKFYQRGIDRAMFANARGLKQGWHVMLCGGIG